MERPNPGCANAGMGSVRLTPQDGSAPARAECVQCEHPPHTLTGCSSCRTSLRLTRIEVHLGLPDGTFGYL